MESTAQLTSGFACDVSVASLDFHPRVQKNGRGPGPKRVGARFPVHGSVGPGFSAVPPANAPCHQVPLMRGFSETVCGLSGAW